MSKTNWPSAHCWAHVLGYTTVLGIGCVIGVTQFWDMNFQITGGDWLQLLGMALVPIVYYLLVQRRHDEELDITVKREAAERENTERKERTRLIILALIESEIQPLKNGMVELFNVLIQPIDHENTARRYANQVGRMGFLLGEHLVVTERLLAIYQVNGASPHTARVRCFLEDLAKATHRAIKTEFGHEIDHHPIYHMVLRKAEVLLSIAALIVEVQTSGAAIDLEQLAKMHSEAERLKASRAITAEQMSRMSRDK